MLKSNIQEIINDKDYKHFNTDLYPDSETALKNLTNDTEKEFTTFKYYHDIEQNLNNQLKNIEHRLLMGYNWWWKNMFGYYSQDEDERMFSNTSTRENINQKYYYSPLQVYKSYYKQRDTLLKTKKDVQTQLYNFENPHFSSLYPKPNSVDISGLGDIQYDVKFIVEVVPPKENLQVKSRCPFGITESAVQQKISSISLTNRPIIDNSKSNNNDHPENRIKTYLLSTTDNLKVEHYSYNKYKVSSERLSYPIPVISLQYQPMVYNINFTDNLRAIDDKSSNCGNPGCERCGNYLNLKLIDVELTYVYLRQAERRILAQNKVYFGNNLCKLAIGGNITTPPTCPLKSNYYSLYVGDLENT
jgi:hypothetical protein